MRIWKIAPCLLLCLLLLACLFPVAFADGLSDLQNAINSGETSFTLEGGLSAPRDSLTIPSGFTLTIAGGTGYDDKPYVQLHNLTIESGGAVVVEDYADLLIDSRINLEGSLSIGNDSELFITDPDEALVYSQKFHRADSGHIVVHYYPANEKEIYEMFTRAEALPNYAHGNIHVQFDWTPDRSIESEKTDFHLHMASFVIPAGKSFRLDYLYLGSALFTVEGTLTVNCRLNDSNSSAVYLMNGCSFNVGEFWLQGSLWAGSDVDRGGFHDGLIDNGFVCTEFNGGYLYEKNDGFTTLKNAIEDYNQGVLPGGGVQIGGGIITITEFVTIPEGMLVGTNNATLVIPNGVTLTLKGRIPGAAAVRVMQGGKLILDGSDTWLNVMGTFTLDGSLVLNSTWIDITAEQWSAWENTGSFARLSCTGDAGVNVDAVVRNAEALVQAYDAYDNFTGADNVRYWVIANYDWVVTEDMTIPEGLCASVSYNNGSLTVDQGATLTINGSLTAGGNAVNTIKVNGTLINNNFLELYRRLGEDQNPKLIVNGQYQGSGTIVVYDDNNPVSYFQDLDLSQFTASTADGVTTYTHNPRLPDLILPADLTTIGSEAFAGGSFGAVYIPAGITSIADDAFGVRTELTVFGFSESEAEAFAERKGFTFVSLEALAVPDPVHVVPVIGVA